MTSFIRDRARLVCVRCHKRKIRCDLQDSGDGTCAACRRMNITCVRREGIRKSRARSTISTISQSPQAGPPAIDRSDPITLDDSRSANTAWPSQPTLQRHGQGSQAFIAEHSVLQHLHNKDPADDPTTITQPPPESRRMSPVNGHRLTVLKASEADVLPRPATRHALYDAFFRSLAHALPIIHRSELESPASSILLQQAVCLAGSLLRHPNVPDSFSRTNAFYEKVKLLLCLDAEPDMLSVIKALCVLTLWSPHSPETVNLNGAWHATGSALRLALQMGLHQNSTYEGQSDARSRRRIWWFLYASDCAHALITGRPPMLRPADFDVPTLTLADFDGYQDEAAKYFIADVSLARIMGQVASKLRDQSSDEDGELVTALLVEWINKLPSELILFSSVGERNPHSFPAIELNICYLGIVILSRALRSQREKDWPCSTLCLVSSACIAHLYEEILDREEVALLMSMHPFWCLIAALPLFYCKTVTPSIEKQRQESLDILRAVIQQLSPRHGLARTVNRKLLRLDRVRTDIISQRPTLLSDFPYQTTAPNQFKQPEQIEALIPQLRMWLVTQDICMQDAIIAKVVESIDATEMESRNYSTLDNVHSVFDALGDSAFMDAIFDNNYLNEDLGFDLSPSV